MQTRRSVALLAVTLVAALSAVPAAATEAVDSAVAVSVQKDVVPMAVAPTMDVHVFALEAISVSYRAHALATLQAVPAAESSAMLLTERGSRTTSLRATRMPSAIHRLTRQQHTWRNRLPATDTALSRRLQV
jgi:hypothetical protein